MLVMRDKLGVNEKLTSNDSPPISMGVKQKSTNSTSNAIATKLITNPDNASARNVGIWSKSPAPIGLSSTFEIESGLSSVVPVLLVLVFDVVVAVVGRVPYDFLSRICVGEFADADEERTTAGFDLRLLGSV